MASFLIEFAVSEAAAAVPGRTVPANHTSLNETAK